jgi:hypothetical protein
LSNIIRQGHAVVHDIQPFTIVEAAVALSTPAPGHVGLGSVITGADASAVSVRLFDCSSSLSERKGYDALQSFETRP